MTTTTPGIDSSPILALATISPGGGGLGGAFPALPPLPADPPASAVRVILRGSGGATRADALYALWRAQGRPPTLGIMASGPASLGLAGYSIITTPGNFGAMVATNLVEREGRLFGRIGYHRGALPAEPVGLGFDTWYSRDLYGRAGASFIGQPGNKGVLRLTMRSAGGSDAVFTWTATSRGTDDSHIFFDGANVRLAEDFPPPGITRQALPLPFAGAAGVHFIFQSTGVRRKTSVTGGYADRLLTALRGISFTKLGSFRGVAMAWIGGAEPLARAGVWVRRLSASDASRQYRFDAGAGERAAVLVLESGTITRRPVRFTDFSGDAYNATDWVRAAAEVTDEVDLSEAKLTLLRGKVAGEGWILFASGSSGEPGIIDIDGGGTLPTDGGAYVRMFLDGQAQWVPTREFEC